MIANGSAPHVYAAIADVTKALSKEGISKDRKNQQQGYSFRGIDDVYNALAPFLADAGLCILPKITERNCTERETQKGGVLFNVVVRAEFDFVSAKDGSSHQVVTYGEAMDSADKATNKAMSAAYKYAAMQAFCIPTEGDNDADAHTPEPRGSWQTNQKTNGKPSAHGQQYTTQASADMANKRIAEEAVKKAALDKSLQIDGTEVLPPANGKPWKTFKEMCSTFRHVKGLLEPFPMAYDDILDRFKVKRAEDFQSGDTALQCYAALMAKVEEVKQQGGLQ